MQVDDSDASSYPLVGLSGPAHKDQSPSSVYTPLALHGPPRRERSPRTRRSFNALPLTSWAARTAEARRQADRGNGRRGAFIWTVRSASTIGRPEHKTARIRSQVVDQRRHPRPTNKRSQCGVYFPQLEHRIGRVFGCCRWPPPFGSADCGSWRV